MVRTIRRYCRTRKRSLLCAIPFVDQHNRSILAPPGVADAQTLHDGVEAVPHGVAVALLRSKDARDLFCVRPSRYEYFGARLISRERAQRAADRDRVQGHRPRDVDDRLGAQLVPAGRELASEELYEVFYCQAAHLQVGDRGEDEGRRVAPGLGQQLLGSELRVGVAHGAPSVCCTRDDSFLRVLYAWTLRRVFHRVRSSECVDDVPFEFRLRSVLGGGFCAATRV